MIIDSQLKTLILFTNFLTRKYVHFYTFLDLIDYTRVSLMVIINGYFNFF